MPARSLWIRLFLSFAMILNGSVAVAGVMPGMAVAGVTSQADASMAGAGHCDEMDMQQAVADSKPGNAQHASGSQHTGDSNDHTAPDHSTPDCCKGGACHCACTQATAGGEFLPVAFAIIAISEATSLVDRSVAAARPSRLDRPPIA
ncbi:MAG: CopL family metal-binding regulatory protein [Dokdonella sp.]